MGVDGASEIEPQVDSREQEISQVLNRAMRDYGKDTDHGNGRDWSRSVALTGSGTAKLSVRYFPERDGDFVGFGGEENTIGYVTLAIGDERNTEVNYSLHNSNERVSEVRHWHGIRIGSKSDIKRAEDWSIEGDRMTEDGKDQDYDRENLTDEEAIETWMKWMPALRPLLREKSDNEESSQPRIKERMAHMEKFLSRLSSGKWREFGDSNHIVAVLRNESDNARLSVSYYQHSSDPNRPKPDGTIFLSWQEYKNGQRLRKTLEYHPDYTGVGNRGIWDEADDKSNDGRPVLHRMTEEEMLSAWEKWESELVKVTPSQLSQKWNR